MKFTKILAISLLTLGAMQLINAETFKLDLTKGETAINQLLKIGDVVELSFLDVSGSTGNESDKITIVAPEYLQQAKETPDRSGMTSKRTVRFTVIWPSDGTPIILKQQDKDLYTIPLTTMQPATYVIDFSDPKTIMDSRDLTNIAGGSGKLNLGDLIKIKLPEYNSGTFYSYNAEFPQKALNKIAELKIKDSTVFGAPIAPAYIFEVKKQYGQSTGNIKITSSGTAGSKREYTVKFAVNNLLIK